MDAFTLQLTAIAHGGAALGRHEGRVIFIPYALPGETVRAKITEDKGRYAFARLIEVLEPSPDRVIPPCPYFVYAAHSGAGCGGCQRQHVDYQAQLRLKTEIVADQLTRIGGITDPAVRSTLPDRSGWAYRNHAQFHPVPGGGLGFVSGSGERSQGREPRARGQDLGLEGRSRGRGSQAEGRGAGSGGEQDSPFFCHDLFPIPLVDISAVVVIEKIVFTHGAHIGVNALADFAIELLKRNPFPFGRRLHDLGIDRILVIVIRDVELNGRT